MKRCALASKWILLWLLLLIAAPSSSFGEDDDAESDPFGPAAPSANAVETKVEAKAEPTTAEEKPATEKPATEKPATEKPATEKPAAAKPAAALAAPSVAPTTGPPTVKADAGPKTPPSATTPAVKPTVTPTAPPPAPVPPPPPGEMAVVTIDAARVIGKLVSLADGKLTIGGDPGKQIPLDEIEHIEFGQSATLALTWIGQDGRDLVQVGGNQAGNGIVDMHLRLSGVSTERKIKQIAVVCRYPGQVRAWRADTTQSPAWKIGHERAESSSVVDLYLEPAKGDAFDQKFDATITFEDGSTATCSTKGSTHTSDQTKITAPAVATAGAADKSSAASIIVHLPGQLQLQGQLVGMDEEKLTLKTSWSDPLSVPLLRVNGLWFGAVSTEPAKQMFRAALEKPRADDVAIVVSRDQSLTEIVGNLKGFEKNQLRLIYEGETRGINQSRLVGVAMAARPTARPNAAAYQVVQFTGGDKISGVLTNLADQNLEFKTSWDSPLTLPATSVARIAFRNGKLVYLSDIEPVTVEEVGYFGRVLHYRRDANLSGAPLKIKGSAYPKGLAVHSRSSLSYALDGQFDSFKATVGFDDDGQGRGAVSARVLADDREVFARPNLRPADGPVEIDAALGGARVLTLEIDFGDLEDTGDRVIWGGARILRASAK